MSISSALSIARSGLQVNGLRAETVATNVANASTAGYVRRSVILAETILGAKTAGVQSLGISRELDTQIKSQRRELTSGLGQASVLASTWQAISARIGSTADGPGLFRAVSNFETALSNAVNTPESNSGLASLLNMAKAAASELNSLSTYAASLRGEADREIADGVTVVNTSLKQIEELNKRLSGMDRTTGQAAALFDERQRVLDTISEYLPIQTVERASGTIDVLTREGVYLVAGKAREISFQPASAFGPGQTLAGGQLSGLSVDGVDLTPGSDSYAAVSSGLFSALFTLRDTDVPAFSAQLDMVAADLVSRFSDDTIDPTKTPGAEGLFVDPHAGPTLGLAGRIGVNAAVDPAQGGEIWRLRDGLGAAAEGPPGDQSILSAMYGAVTAVQYVSANGIQGSYSLSGMAAQLSSLAGQQRVHHESVLSSTQTQHAIMVEAEQNKTGVDTDREMQDLMLIEQAYAANARVIQVAAELVRLLMEL